MLSLQSLGPFGPGDFFAYIEYPSQSVRYLLVYTLTKAFQTCAPLARHNSYGLLPQPQPNSLPPLTDRKNGLIIKMFISLANLLEDKK